LQDLENSARSQAKKKIIQIIYSRIQSFDTLFSEVSFPLFLFLNLNEKRENHWSQLKDTSKQNTKVREKPQKKGPTK